MKYFLVIVGGLLFFNSLTAQEVKTKGRTNSLILDFLNNQLLLQVDSGNIENVAKLLNEGANPNYQSSIGVPILTYAIQTEKQQLVTLLLLRGANPNLKTFEKNSPLHTAVYLNLDTIAEILIKYKADINATNINNVTPLHYAIANGYPYLTTLLLYYGADPNIIDNEGNSTVMLATYVGALQILEILLEEGVNPNKSDNNGYTPLMIASQYNDTTIIRKLLEAGANSRIKNYSGHDALSIAIYYEASEAAKILLNTSKDIIIDKRNNYIQLAKENRLNNIYNMLREKGCESKIKLRISHIEPYMGFLMGKNETMLEGGIMAIEALTKTRLTFGFASRPKEKTVDIYNNNTTYQLKEKRNIIAIGIERIFPSNSTAVQKSLYPILGVKLGYTWNDFKGTSMNKESKVFVTPSFGLLYRTEKIDISCTGELMKLEETSNNHLRVSLKIAVPIQIGYRINPKQINWLK